jgi:hypothetical protein
MNDPKYVAEVEALKNVKKTTSEDIVVDVPAPLTAQEKSEAFMEKLGL